ncbi:MAG TPA: MFS transporter [Sphingobium sp.]|nr:MFS transporter [Sphingobium sp.]
MRTPPGMGMAEFILLMALLMAMNALSIDPMLPAMPDMGRDLDVLRANDRQLIITVYFAGFGLGSLFYGPLSDRYGRRPVLLVSIALFIVATTVCAVSPNFAVMLVARAAAGFFAAAGRVVVVGIVRDCVHGDRMASVMSLIFIVFMIVPILAPS